MSNPSIEMKPGLREEQSDCYGLEVELTLGIVPITNRTVELV